MGISCHDYDRLELAAMRKIELTVTLQSEEGRYTHKKCVIQDLFVENGREFLLTAEEEIWPLDKIITIET